MSFQFEAIEGILLAIASEVPSQDQTAIEDCLLLSWLAANKANAPDKLSQIMGQIGWTISEASTATQTVEVRNVGAAIEQPLQVSTQPVPDFGNILAATGGPEKDLAAQWWQSDGVGHILATADVKGDVVLRLVQATIELPEPWQVLFVPTAQASVKTQSLTFTLNAELWTKVKQDVAAKVAPYRTDIHRL